MAKQIFKNLPDTSTPLSAEKLNGLLDGEEALGQIVVDSVRSKNMFDKTVVARGYRIGSSGNIQEHSDYFTSTFIEVKPSTQYTIQKNATATYSTYAFYDSSKTFISRSFYGTTTATITTPSNAKYVRLADLLTTLDSLQFEIGSSATSYMPFEKIGGYSEPVSLLNYTAIEQGSEYTLNEEITNFKYIIVQLSTATNEANSNKQYLPVSLITAFDNTSRVAISLFQSTNVYVFGDFYFSAPNKIYCNAYTKGSTGWNGRLKVWGIR